MDHYDAELSYISELHLTAQSACFKLDSSVSSETSARRISRFQSIVLQSLQVTIAELRVTRTTTTMLILSYSDESVSRARKLGSVSGQKRLASVTT